MLNGFYDLKMLHSLKNVKRSSLKIFCLSHSLRREWCWRLAWSANDVHAQLDSRIKFMHSLGFETLENPNWLSHSVKPPKPVMCLFLTSSFVPHEATKSILDDVSNSSEKLSDTKIPPAVALNNHLTYLHKAPSFESTARNSVRSCSAYAKPWQKILKAYMSEKWVATQNVDDNASKSSEAVTSERFPTGLC